MHSTKLKVAAVPLDIEQTQPLENIKRLEEKLGQLPDDVDVVVLPELFSTGFIAEPEKILALAEPTSGPTLEAIGRIAAKINAAVCGSFLCKKDNRFYNTAFFIEPDGNRMFYNKRHLFCISPEAKVLSPGRERSPIIRFRGWNLAMVICYDIRFPVWCRNVGELYEVLLVPANWPTARAYAWKHLLIGRAIENQAYVVGANRAGTDDFGDYNNLTYIFDPLGKPEGETNAETGIAIATFDKDYLFNVKRRLPVGRDAEDFNISDL